MKTIPMRDAYGNTLVQLGEQNNKIVVLEADVGGSTKSNLFGSKFPERYFNVGISELNMMAMAAGFEAGGMIPFVNTFAVFMTTRALDAINSFIAHDNQNVKLVGTYCGLSDSYDGASHQAITDVTIMRSLPNMTVISPCDQFEAEQAVIASVEHKGPVYLRINRNSLPIVNSSDYRFELGKGVILREGTDLTIIASGYMVYKALEAAELLAEKSINAQVVNIHTIKPIDSELLISCAKKTGSVLTVEEHSVYGGLGSAVAEVLSQNYPVPMHMIGVSDFAESGDYEMLLSKYGLEKSIICKHAELLLKK